MTTSTTNLTASKARRIINWLNLTSEQATVTGKGSEFEIECLNEKIQRLVTKATGIKGGYKTGYGSWVLRPGYRVSDRALIAGRG